MITTHVHNIYNHLSIATVDTFYKMPSPTALCNLDSTLHTSDINAVSWKAINHLNSLIVERIVFMLTECTSFFGMTILPV